MTEDVENQGVDKEAVKGRLKGWLIASLAWVDNYPKRFRVKGVAVRVKKTRQNKRLEPRFCFNQNRNGSDGQAIRRSLTLPHAGI
jgi:hypothetical protein